MTPGNSARYATIVDRRHSRKSGAPVGESDFPPARIVTWTARVAWRERS